MKHQNEEDARRAWRQGSHMLQTACTDCGEQRLCRGNRRATMRCEPCYLRANLRVTIVRRMSRAGQL